MGASSAGRFGRLRLPVAAVLLWAGAGSARAQTWTSDAPTTREDAAERSFWLVDSDATFTAYAIASTLSPVVWERRRFVETLGLRHELRLGEDPSKSRFTIETSVALRLDQDFGRDCLLDRDGCYDATAPTDDLAYQPLARRTRLDVPTFQVALQGSRGLRLTAGRQMAMDSAGLYRFDGASAALSPHPWVALSAFGGRQVQPGSFAGSPGLGVQGSIHVVLPESLAPTEYPAIAPPARTWTYGGGAEVGTARYLRLRGFVRELRDESGLVLSYAGVGATSRPHPAVLFRGDLVWELGRRELVEAFAEASVHWLEATARVRVRHHVPRFDLGSIWSFFDPVPVSQLEVALDAPPLGDVRVGAIGRARRSHPGNDGERDLGGELWGRVDRGAWRAELRGFLWAGSLAPVAAVLGELRRALGPRGAAWMRASVWHFDDPWRAQRSTNSVSIALGGELRLTRATRFALDAEWAHSALVHHRLRVLFSFLVRAWK